MVVPIVYTFGIMSEQALINIKTKPELKERAFRVARKLGVSINAVLNNELRRFAAEESVVFETPEAPNPQTQKLLKRSRAQIEAGDYYKFTTNKRALEFLCDELK